MVPRKRGVQAVLLKVWLAGVLLAGGSTALAADPAAQFDADDWRIVPAAELAMKSEPNAPGAAAVYLYVQVHRDDETSRERIYEQVKILTEEGRNLASIELQYDKAGGSIRDIEARVVQPDGSIVPFKGTVYDRPIASGRDVKMQARTFTLPDVRVGSIIEYRYELRQRANVLYNSRWVLSQDLFTRLARYSILLYQFGNARWDYPNGLPEGTGKPEFKDRRLSLEVRNIPAFVTERYMPPANQLRYQVVFRYVSDQNKETDPAKFWKKTGTLSYKAFNRFAEDSGAVRKALAGIIAAGDSVEQKVRKIYDHVQKLRNTTYEPELDAQEARRRNDRVMRTASEVARNGYGDAWDMMAYFLALVRSAGIPAEPVLVASRSNRFFSERTLDSGQFDSTAIAVTLGGRELLLHPGNPQMPFGALHWSDTAVRALRLNKDGGEWMTMPLPQAADAATTRKAQFTLTADGELQGTVVVTHGGQEALWRRMQQRDEDEETRREFLEGDLKDMLAGAAQVKVLRQPDWTSRDEALQIEYQVTLPQWAVVSGNRILLGMGMFGGEEKGVFVAATRVHPIYYRYPSMTRDEVQITLPAGFHLQGRPDAWPAAKAGGLVYAASAESRGAVLEIRRELTLETLLSRKDTYPGFRDFYQAVRAGDAQQLVLVR